MIRIVVVLIAMVGIVLAVLLNKGEFGRFQFGVGKDGVNVEVESVKPPVGLTEEILKKEFDKRAKFLQSQIDELNNKPEGVSKPLSSGAPEEQKVLAEIKTLKKELAGVQAKLGDTQKALADRKAVLAETKKVLANEKLKSAVPKDQLKEAKQKLEEGDASSVEELYSQFIEKKQSRDEPWAAMAFVLGKLAHDRLDYQTAFQYYEQAALLSSGNANFLNLAGILAHILGEYDQAIGYLQKALASYLTVSPEHPNVASIWNNLGMVLKYKGEYDKAIGYYERALALNLKIFGLEHPNVASIWNNLGAMWHENGDYDQAIDYYEKALESDLKSLGSKHPNVARDWNNLGLVWNNKGDYDKAIGYYEKALPVFEKTGMLHRAQAIKHNITKLKKERDDQRDDGPDDQ